MSRCVVGTNSAAPATSRQDVRTIARRRVSQHEKTEQSAQAVTERSIKILWIDDDLRRDEGGVVLLGLEGFSVDCADCGRGGLRSALSRSYAGIILDLRLPDVSGLSVLARMAAADVTAPVLVLTGFGDTESAVAAMKLGAKDFREKPLLAEELIQAVTALTASHSDGPHVRADAHAPQTGPSETPSLAAAA